MGTDEERKERFSGLICLGNPGDLAQTAYAQGLSDMAGLGCGDAAASALWRDCRFEVLEYQGHYVVTWVEDGGGHETREEARNAGREIVSNICESKEEKP
jgi:hypothetical protein